jgi:hemerythrin-like metal-binding protein
MSELSGRQPERHSKDPVQAEEIERQHETMIALMKDLGERASAGASRAVLADLLQRLSDYTVLHFQAEEAYMAATSYPKLDTHRLIHRDLLIRLREHIRGFETGNGRIGHPLTSFLKYWLAAHINSVDIHFARNAQ